MRLCGSNLPGPFCWSAYQQIGNGFWTLSTSPALSPPCTACTPLKVITFPWLSGGLSMEISLSTLMGRKTPVRDYPLVLEVRRVEPLLGFLQ